MAKKGKLWHTDTELPEYRDILNNETVWDEVEKDATAVFNLDHNGKSGVKAKSNKASGRWCPKCASTLRVKEQTDNGTIILMCWNCHSTWYDTDLNAVWETDDKGRKIVDAVGDGMFRRIDDNMVNNWMEYFSKYKGTP